MPKSLTPTKGLRIARALVALAGMAALLMLMSGPVAAQQTLTVDNTDPISCDDAAGNPYCTIQAAIDDADPGDTIEVAAGTYVESVEIGKSNITLQGAGSDSTTIAPSSGHAVATIAHTEGLIDGITVHGFTIEPVDGKFAFIAFSGTVVEAPDTTNLTLDDIQVVDSTFAIVLNAVENVTLSNIVLSGIAPPEPAGAVELTGASNLNIVHSRFEGNTTAIRLQDTEGLHGQPDAYGSNGQVTVHNTSFTGNGAAVVNRDADITIDASGNWWGSNDEATVAADIDGDVDFTPFLDSGDDTSADPGFQGDFSTLNVTALGEQVGSVGRIQEGVDLVDGSIVNVAAGTYEEGPPVVLANNVTIIGANRETTVIKPTASTGSSGDARGWFLVEPGVEANVSGLTFDGDGFDIYQAWRVHGTGTFENLAFKNMRFSTYLGWGLAALGGDGPVDVLDSTFDNIGRIGVQYFGPGTSGTFDGNTYTGKGHGDHLDYGVEVGGGASPVEISNNSITGNRGEASSDGSESAAILVTTFFGAGSSATVIDNTLSENTLGIAVGFDQDDTSDVAAHNNNIVGNTSRGVTSTAPQVDATCNWWGNASGPAHSSNPVGAGDSVSTDVDFEPWLVAPAPGGACIGPAPEVSWLPPVTNDEFTLQDGTTLPLKFQLVDGNDDLIEEEQAVYLVVNEPGGNEVVRWELGDDGDALRFDEDESFYAANLHTRDHELNDQDYTAVVHDFVTDAILGEITFEVSTEKGSGRGKGQQ